MNRKFLGQNATRHSRGRRTHVKQSGQRPSGSQLAGGDQEHKASTPHLPEDENGQEDSESQGYQRGRDQVPCCRPQAGHEGQAARGGGGQVFVGT